MTLLTYQVWWKTCPQESAAMGLDIRLSRQTIQSFILSGKGKERRRKSKRRVLLFFSQTISNADRNLFKRRSSLVRSFGNSPPAVHWFCCGSPFSSLTRQCFGFLQAVSPLIGKSELILLVSSQQQQQHHRNVTMIKKFLPGLLRNSEAAS